MVPRMAWYAPIQGHPVHLDICRIHEEVVGGDADHSHQNRTQHRPDQGALAALVLAVHQAGAQHEHSPQDEVAELTHSGTGAEGQVPRR